MKVFDMHIHFVPSEREYPKFIEELQRYSEEYNVVKMALIGGYRYNEMVKRAFTEYPDLFLGYAWIDLDEDKPEVIKMYKEQGFSGLKMIIPSKNYDDPSYFPFYEIAEELGMVILFHTGIIGGPYDYLLKEGSEISEEMKKRNKNLVRKGKVISSARMRSIYLDTIANAFPDLKIIGAHLGWPEYSISCAIARWRKNLYFDISGGEVVERHIIEGHYIGKEISIDKLVFGTDSSIKQMPDRIMTWYYSLRSIGLSEEEIEKIFYFNAARLFNLED